MKHHATIIRDPDLHRRLRASRCAAGHMTVTKIIRRLGVPEPTYRGVEAGERNASEKVLAGAASTFGVSYEYLADGTIKTPRDQKAAHLRDFLAKLSKDLEQGSEPSTWLKERRQALGYRTASAAARAFKWAVSSYVAHENGTRPVPNDRMTLYAMKLDTDLASLLASQPAATSSRPSAIKEDEPRTEWKISSRLSDLPEAGRRTEPTIAGSSSGGPVEIGDDVNAFWRELKRKSGIYGPTARAPFLVLAPDEAALRWDMELAIPLSLVRNRGIFDRNEAFCVELTFSSNQRVVTIVQKTSARQGDKILVFDGRRIRHAQDHDKWIEGGDPSAPSSAARGPLMLGVVRGEISVYV